ncbi:OmpA family protein [Pedobacter sp. HMF7647]|uniref:OmpA family protein n=1 Tax=Hufsiella arboris TaxID=2695275 RepID=A0A7K1YBV1_9SPHI|nr:OmpA family protein [Hufsiella arboris]MXV52082.1 OmpA family protein [Hufsiella arboris]
MKMTFLKSSALLSAVMLSSGLYAQDSLSTSGASSNLKPFSPVASYRTWSIGVHGGVLTPKAFFGNNDYTGNKADIGYGAYIKNQILPGFGLRADFLRGKLEGSSPRGSFAPSFSTEIHWSAALSGELTLANINWLNGSSVMRPYVTAGFGFMGYKPVLEDASGAQTNFKQDNNGTVNEVFFPVGAGIKFQLAKGINLDLGYQVNFNNNDNLDGYNYGSQNDRFGYGHAGLEFALGDKNKPQLAAKNQVKMMYDDYTSQNQDLKNQLADERSKNAQQIAAMQSRLDSALADSDGDGVIDRLDKCPNTPANTKVDGSGCPLAPAKVIITEEDRRIVRDAIANLEFDFGKATIRAKSYPSLDRVAEILINKNFSLKLAGHTDNVGSDAANLKLSKERAESIRSYLVSKGANASRIEATGYGESQPIATNKTAAGRQQNRRVEFTLY